MKKIITTVILALSLAACNDDKSERKTPPEATDSREPAPRISMLDPCELINSTDISSVFQADENTVERYARSPYTDTKRCEYLWTDPNDTQRSQQLIVTLSVNNDQATMPRKYSNMLRIALEKGLLGADQKIIMPSPIDGFGEYGYQWQQTAGTPVLKLSFQKSERYLVEVMFSTNLPSLPDTTAGNLSAIGTVIWDQL